MGKERTKIGIKKFMEIADYIIAFPIGLILSIPVGMISLYMMIKEIHNG